MGEMISKVREERLSSFEGLQLTDQTFNLAIGLTLVVGILVDMIIAHYLTDLVFRLSPILMLIIYLAGSIGCTMVIYRSAKPVVSFLGFLGLAVCMGLMLTYFISMYELGTVQLAFTLTGGVFVVMVVLSTLFPSFFLSIGRGLGITLLVTIVVEIIATLVLPAAMWALTGQGPSGTPKRWTTPSTVPRTSMWISSICSSAFCPSWANPKKTEISRAA